MLSGQASGNAGRDFCPSGQKLLLEPILSKIPNDCRASRAKLNARAGKKEGGWGEGIFARSRFPPPLNFVLTKLARRLKLRLTDFVVFRQIFSYLSNNPPHSTTVKPFLSGVIMFGCSRMICDSSGLK